MNSREWQRLLTGASMVMQETAKNTVPSLFNRAFRVNQHNHEFINSMVTLLGRNDTSVQSTNLNLQESAEVGYSRFSVNPFERYGVSEDSPSHIGSSGFQESASAKETQDLEHLRLSAGLQFPSATATVSAQDSEGAPVAVNDREPLKPVEEVNSFFDTKATSRSVEEKPTQPFEAITVREPANAPIATSVDAPSTPAVTAPPQVREKLAPRRRDFREVAVPSSPLARVAGFGGLAARLAFGAASEFIGRSVGLKPSPPPNAETSRVPLSEAQAQRLADGLCKMRGAALKVGQMLSLSDESIMPPDVVQVLERVRAQADIMPQAQLESMMRGQFGSDWREEFGGDAFQLKPIAAASIGQVHITRLKDGRKAAVKIQYPGVAESIHSDLNNLKKVLAIANFLPKGLYLDSIIRVAKEELTAECDYIREAAAQERFRQLLADDPDFEVPEIIPELSTKHVLTSTWLEGFPIDHIIDAGIDQETRNKIARRLLKLTLRELFEWRLMQTDPNWGNFFYNPEKDVIGLLDFGATRSYSKKFLDKYLKLVWAAANHDREGIEKLSIELGFLTGYESKQMIESHLASGLIIGEPFADDGPYDFKTRRMTKKVLEHTSVFAEQRLAPPPDEIYSLHRKLAGAFLICIKIGASIPCRDLLVDTYNNYKWGYDENAEPDEFNVDTKKELKIAEVIGTENFQI